MTLRAVMLASLALAGVGVALVVYAQSGPSDRTRAAPAPSRPSAAPAPARAAQPVPAREEPYVAKPIQQDEARKRLLRLFARSPGPTPESERARTALMDTLKSGDQSPDVSFGEAFCRFLGCYIDVTYRSPAAFLAFDRGKYGDHNSPF